MPSTAVHQGIVIIGAPRSGTTLLRRVLDAHPNISCPGETNLLTACARFLHSERVVDSMDVGVLDGLAFIGYESEEVVSRLREFAFDFRREHAQREGKERWAEKTAIDAFHLESIERLCGGNAYFVCMIRHGLDVAMSMRDWCEKREAYPSELHRYIQRHPRPLEAFAHAWADVGRSIRSFANRHPNDSIVVRYEDMVTNPADELSRIVHFVRETWDANLPQRALDQTDAKGFSDWKTFSTATIDRKSIGGWRELPRATIAELARIVNPTLGQFGYPVVDVEEPGRGSEARRRYELGLSMQVMKRQRR